MLKNARIQVLNLNTLLRTFIYTNEYHLFHVCDRNRIPFVCTIGNIQLCARAWKPNYHHAIYCILKFHMIHLQYINLAQMKFSEYKLCINSAYYYSISTWKTYISENVNVIMSCKRTEIKAYLKIACQFFIVQWLLFFFFVINLDARTINVKV